MSARPIAYVVCLVAAHGCGADNAAQNYDAAYDCAQVAACQRSMGFEYTSAMEAACTANSQNLYENMTTTAKNELEKLYQRCSSRTSCDYIDCAGEVQERRLSAGLKIFVTSQPHIGNFADDPYLMGETPIAKADAFCNSDPDKPGDATYKALLVDGANRDAIAQTDWVLLPATTYYQSYGDVMIGTTTKKGILASAFRPLENPIGSATKPREVWTGISDATDFSAGQSCAGWSNATNAYGAARGLSDEIDGNAFAAVGDIGCEYFQLHLYCVEQPELVTGTRP